jgi:hypothetical protein
MTKGWLSGSVFHTCGKQRALGQRLTAWPFENQKRCFSMACGVLQKRSIDGFEILEKKGF